jgi:membrane-bound inhibitor of C-type lysozyme
MASRKLYPGCFSKRKDEAMKVTLKPLVAGTAVLLGCIPANATDVTLHLNGQQPMTMNEVRYRCDEQGGKLGLPTGTFSVQYVNGAGNSLAILPIGGVSLIFSNVMSGSGARYAAGTFIWWEAAGRSITLSSDSLAGKSQSTCQRVQ